MLPFDMGLVSFENTSIKDVCLGWQVISQTSFSKFIMQLEQRFKNWAATSSFLLITISYEINV